MRLVDRNAKEILAEGGVGLKLGITRRACGRGDTLRARLGQQAVSRPPAYICCAIRASFRSTHRSQIISPTTATPSKVTLRQILQMRSGISSDMESCEAPIGTRLDGHSGGRSPQPNGARLPAGCTLHLLQLRLRSCRRPRRQALRHVICPLQSRSTSSSRWGCRRPTHSVRATIPTSPKAIRNGQRRWAEGCPSRRPHGPPLPAPPRLGLLHLAIPAISPRTYRTCNVGIAHCSTRPCCRGNRWTRSLLFPPCRVAPRRSMPAAGLSNPAA